MVCQDDVESLVAILTEARWLRVSGEPVDRIESWVRASLRQRLPRLPLTTGRALTRSSA